MPVMRAALHIASVASLSALVWLIVECALTVRAARRAAYDAVALIDWHAAEIERRTDERLGDAIAMLDRRLASVEDRADRRLAEAIARADGRLGEALAHADTRLIEALGEVRVLRSDAQATLAETRGLVADVRQSYATAAARLDYWTDCEQNGLCWQGAATDTLLAIRRAALSIDSAMPQIVASAEASAQGVQATAQASAQTAENLARITQPGPRWLRWVGLGLGVAAPAAQTALPFAVRSARLR